MNEIFRQVLDDDTIALTPTMTAEDVEGWDSMNHIFIVVEIEKRFGIKFQAAEMEELKNVGELAALVREKVSASGR
jgi:acyl carrier protein